MKKVKDISKIVYIKNQGGEFRWITISTVLLALGAILHLIAPSFGGVTPNFLIATYVTAILLVKPSYKEAIGIGLVAGIIQMLTSKSSFAYGNLASEFIGSSLAYLLARYANLFKFGKLNFAPAVTGFLVTVASGATFVAILFSLGFAPMEIIIFVIFPIVLLTALVNLVLTIILYFPAQEFFQRNGVLDKEEIKESNHDEYIFEPQTKGKIVMENLSYTYFGQKEAAIKNINLAVQDGEFLVIAGLQGSGKSTVALSMIGAIPHFYGGKMEGMVFVNNKAITQERISDLALDIGMVLADYDTQLVTMTVGDEIAFAMENHGIPAGEIAIMTKELLQEVGLEGLETRKITDLSGGQRQRLAIASALATNASILILDDPTSAMDPEGRHNLYKLLARLNRDKGITIVLVEDDLDCAELYADQVIIMENGAIVCQGTYGEIIPLITKSKSLRALLPGINRIQEALAVEGITFAKDFHNLEEGILALQRKLEKVGEGYVTAK